MPARSSIFLWLGQNKKFSDQYRLAKQAQIDDLLKILEFAGDDSPNDWFDRQGKAARPAAWSTATIFDEPSFGSRPESRTSRGYQEILHLMLGITRLCRRLFERVGWICLSWNKSYGIVTTTVASAPVSQSFNAW